MDWRMWQDALEFEEYDESKGEEPSEQEEEIDRVRVHVAGFMPRSTKELSLIHI